MATYIKDYSGKTAEEWLSEGKWTGFLMSVPIKKKAKRYPIKNANDAMRIRVTASALSNNPGCDRRFKVEVDFDLKFIDVTVYLK